MFMAIDDYIVPLFRIIVFHLWLLFCASISFKSRVLKRVSLKRGVEIVLWNFFEQKFSGEFKIQVCFKYLTFIVPNSTTIFSKIYETS